MATSYEPLPKLDHLPDFLSVNAVLALYPEASGRDSLREEIHKQLYEQTSDVLSGRYLDEAERLFVLWVGNGWLTQVLAVYDGSRLAGRAEIQRGQAFLGDVIAEGTESRSEVLVSNITTLSVCCRPRSLSIYRIGPKGTLTRAFSFEQSYSEVGPGVRWGFMNHFDFAANRVVVERVFPASSERWEFVYEPGSVRFQPTPETQRAILRRSVAPADDVQLGEFR